MQCPVCNENLLMSERQGVEIDYCPKCRGIWLDRGELDKLLSLSEQNSSGSAPRNPQEHRAPRADEYDRRDHDRGYPPQKRKRESWLGDILDF